jgi:tetratricopeptide (TPR) repeat protein
MQLCLRVDRARAGRAAEIEALTEQLAGQPRAWQKRLELADLCYHSGRWAEARSHYERTLAVNPRCFAAVLRLGDMLRHEQQPEAEARAYRAALAQAPPPARRALLEARLLAAEGRDEEAVIAFRRALALDPQARAGYAGLHRALGRLSRYNEQLANLDRLRALDPDDRLALVGVYTPCACLRRFDLAQSLLERAVALDPNDPMAVKHLFQVRMNLGLRDAETVRLAERLVQLAPQFVASWGELAWIYAELGRDEESLAVLQQFLVEHPCNAEAHAALAWRYHYLGREPESADSAARAYALDPGDPYVCWTRLVTIKEEASAVPEAEALRVAAEVVARFPGDANLLVAASAVFWSRGRVAEALHHARRASGQSPASAEVQGHLAFLYRGLGWWEEAANLYRLLAEAPGKTDAASLLRWAEALRAMNDPRAESLFADACALARGAGDDLAYGEVVAVWGKREEAIAAFRRALSRSPLPTHVRLRAERSLQRLGS